jgi:hypothetical protein
MRVNGPAPQKQRGAAGSNVVVFPPCVMWMGFFGPRVLELALLMLDLVDAGVCTEPFVAFDLSVLRGETLDVVRRGLAVSSCVDDWFVL